MNDFNDGPLMVSCCAHVYRRQRPVLVVLRADQHWHFACGQDDDVDAGDPAIVSVTLLLHADPSLAPLFDLAPDSEALRENVQRKWVRMSRGRGK